VASLILIIQRPIPVNRFIQNGLGPAITRATKKIAFLIYSNTTAIGSRVTRDTQMISGGSFGQGEIKFTILPSILKPWIALNLHFPPATSREMNTFQMPRTK